MFIHYLMAIIIVVNTINIKFIFDKRQMSKHVHKLHYTHKMKYYIAI